MEFKSKLFSFRTGKELPEIQKHEDTTPVRHTRPDEFTTQIINSIPFARFNNNRDLLLYFFNNVSEINALVTYVAQKGADIPVKHVKILGNKKEKDISNSSTILPLLVKPNHLNNGRAFMVNSLSSFFVFGYIPINQVKSIGWADPAELWLMPGNQFYPIPEKSVNQYGLPASGVDFRLNPIKQYRLFIDSRPFNFSPEEIIMINDSNLSFVNGQYLTGQSRLYSGIRSIKTLSYIYDTVNTLIAGKGAEGFVYKRSKANDPDPVIEDEEKTRIENRLYSYGTTDGKRPIFLTTKDLGFTRISVPVGDFMPIELKEHEFRTLATAMLFPSKLLNDTAATAYNNVKEASKDFYSNCLIPVVNLFYEALSNGFGLTARGEALRPDYSGIESLMADKKIEAETNKVWNEVFERLWNNDMVSRNQWLEYLGLPTVSDPDFSKRKSEIEPKEPIQPEPINTGINEPIEGDQQNEQPE